MGKTSVKTACKPRFFRLDGATSAWRNSRYELTWISMRFGGAMTSLILPKLIRSTTRDGILTSGYWPAPGRTVMFALNDTTPLFPGGLPGNGRQDFNDNRVPRSVRDFFQCVFWPGEAGRRGSRHPNDVIIYLTSTLAPASSNFFFAE